MGSGRHLPCWLRLFRSHCLPGVFRGQPGYGPGRTANASGGLQGRCGLDAVHLSWGHDEYVYQIAKPYLPAEGLYMLRYHSFYPWHREGQYDYLCNQTDRSMLKWVLDFNQYDLYTKSHEAPDPVALKPFMRI